MKTKWYEEYKGHVIEYNDFMGAYRVTEKEIPYFTCCWTDTIEEAKEIIDDQYQGDEEDEEKKN